MDDAEVQKRWQENFEAVQGAKREVVASRKAYAHSLARVRTSDEAEKRKLLERRLAAKQRVVDAMEAHEMAIERFKAGVQ